MRERMVKGGDQSQVDSYLDRILTAVNMEGSFSFPEVGGVNINISSQPPTVTDTQESGMASRKDRQEILDTGAVEFEAVEAEVPGVQVEVSPGHAGLAGEDPRSPDPDCGGSVFTPLVSVAAADVSAIISPSGAKLSPLDVSQHTQ